MIRKGEVRVNGGRVRAQYRLQSRDIVRIPPTRTAQSKPPSLPSNTICNQLEQRVLFEDSHLLVVNKPSGYAVHGGSGINIGLIETLRLMRSSTSYFELVHRLDRETSGCLLVAKKRSSLRTLHETFRDGKVYKLYTALICGCLKGKRTLVHAPLKKYIKQSGERLVKVNSDGKTAKTLFKPIRPFKSATMISAELLTGRTHQIRVHAAHLGNPIAGDDRYGNKEANRYFRENGLKRLFLHASRLTIKHPHTGKPLCIDAPLDDDLSRVIDRLEHEESI